MKYVVRWSDAKTPYQKPDKYEFSEFLVEEDPDPPGDWIVWYRWYNGDGHIDYWTRRQNERPSAIVARDLTCVAGRVEFIRMTQTRESRLAQLSRLALHIERSTALLEKRSVRRFEGLCQEISSTYI